MIRNWHDRVDVEHRLELLVAHLVDRSVPCVARVVDDDVDLSEVVNGLLNELIGDVGLGEVAGEHRRLALDLLSRLLGDVAIEVVDEDLCAVVGKKLGHGAADAAR